VRAIMCEMGMAMMGAALAVGENRAVEAAQRAISSPLLEDVKIEGARGVRITVIATGFGEPAVKQPSPRPGATEALTDSRPVRPMGRIVDDELDVPTWQRRAQETPAQALERAGAPRRGPVADSVRDEEYDIPTFLRRGAE